MSTGKRWFVVIGGEEFHEFATRSEAHSFWRTHLNKGMAVDPRPASFYAATDRDTLAQWLTGWRPVEPGGAGVQHDYYSSEVAGQAREERQAKALDKGPPWRFEVGDEMSLSVEEVWPDGDAPANPTLADVLDVVREQGKYRIERDWGFQLNVEVEGIDPFNAR